ncbi:hypothetical protein BKA82DRAFT_970489, partial [Pisolithus tinctorius]
VASHTPSRATLGVLPPEPSAGAVRASRLYSPRISHNENSPCFSSCRISGVRIHIKSLIESLYAKRTCSTCFARDSAFCVSALVAVCCVMCTRSTVLTVSTARSPVGARISAMPSG